jgi:hypothetical protein
MLFIELLQEEVLQIFQTKYFNSIQGFFTIKYGPPPRHPTSSATPHPTHHPTRNPKITGLSQNLGQL